jgi:hypothetical protein
MKVQGNKPSQGKRQVSQEKQILSIRETTTLALARKHRRGMDKWSMRPKLGGTAASTRWLNRLQK